MPKVRSSNTHIPRLDDLTPDPQNANRGTERGREALAQSLREFGPGRAVLIDRHGNIIAGNKTVEEAKRLNIPLQVVKTDGDVLIAVQREDLDLTTDSRAKRLAIADNRVGQLDLEWDVDMLKRLHAEGLDLSAFWTAEEFATLLVEPTTGLTNENSVVEPAATDIVPGACSHSAPIACSAAMRPRRRMLRGCSMGPRRTSWQRTRPMASATTRPGGIV